MQTNTITWVGVALIASILTACEPAHMRNSTGSALTGLQGTASQSGRFLAARQAIYHRDLTTAGLFFDQAVSAQADNVMLLEQSFLSHYQSGNLDRAFAVAASLEQMGSTLSISVEPALGVAIRENDWQAVIALSEKMTQTPEGQILSANLRSLAYVGMNEPETALREQQKLADFIADAGIDFPADIQILQQAYLAEMNRKTADALALYRSISLGDDQASYVLLATTSGLWRLGAVEEAKTILQTHSGNDVNLQRFAQLLETGQSSYLRSPDLEQLFAHFIFEVIWFGRTTSGQTLILPRLHLALSIWPGLDLGHLILAQTFVDRLDYDRAALHLDQIDSNSPYTLQAIMLNMQIARETKNATAAFAVLKTALRQLKSQNNDTVLAQDKAVLYRYAGIIARQEEMYRTAVSYLQQALRHGAQTDLVYRNLGISLERLGQTEKAEQAFLKALEMNPDDATTLNYLGYWWADENRHLDLALEFIQKAVALRPSSGYFADSLGWVYFRLGRYDEAVEWLEKAIQLAPTDPLISDHLGDAYWKTGRQVEARYKWNHALDMGIEKKLVDSIKKKIANGLD